MRILCILSLLISWSAIACKLSLSDGESIRFNDEGTKIERTMSKAKEKGWTYITKQEWETHKSFSKEIFKTEYSQMSDAQMTKAIAEKWKIKPETLKQIYIKGNVVEQSCSKIK